MELQEWLYLACLTCLLCSIAGFVSGFLFLVAFYTRIFSSVVPSIVTFFLSSVLVTLYLVLSHVNRLIAKQKQEMAIEYNGRSVSDFTLHFIARLRQLIERGLLRH